MQTCGRCRDCTFLGSEDSLEVCHILCSGMCRFLFSYPVVNDITWKGSLTKCIKIALELVMRTVVKETQCPSSACCVVNNLGHHIPTLIKKELVAYSNLSRRLYKDIPKAHLLVEFPQQEHLNLGICLFLCTIKSCRENLGVIEHESVTLAKVIDYIPKIKIFALYRIAITVFLVQIDSSRLAMEHHKTALVTSCHLESVRRSIRTVYCMN